MHHQGDGRLPGELPFKVHIVGAGSNLNACKQLVEQLSLQNKVVFHGRHPQSQMPCYYKMADCMLLTLRGGDMIGETLPAKAQSYLSVGKPIVGAIDGARTRDDHRSGLRRGRSRR